MSYNTAFVWALYNMKTKQYMLSSGYYGNECNIKCFKTKDDAEKHIQVYYRNAYWKARKMPVKPFNI